MVCISSSGTNFNHYLVVFLVTSLVSMGITPLYRRLALYLKITDQPNQRKLHDEQIPYLGGLVVCTSFFVCLPFFWPLEKFSGMAFVLVAVTVLGLLDDLYDITSSLKLIGLFLIFLIGTQFNLSTNLFPNEPFGPWGVWLDTALVPLWGLAMVSAMNALDNMDGLAPGTGFIASFMFFLIAAFQFPHFDWALYSIAATGALLGFLPYNFHPANIFLGDSGSFFVGALLALLAIIGNWSTHPVKSATIPLVILSVPLLDLLFVLVYRYATGSTDGLIESIEYSAQDHISHRIQQVRGFGQPRTVLLIYGLSLITGLLGVIMRNTHPFESAVALFIVFVLYSFVILLILPSRKDINLRWMTYSHDAE